MDIKTAANVAKAMPSRQSVLLIGKHGIGKSQLVRQLAAHFKDELVKEGKLSPDVPVCDVAKDKTGKVDAFLIDRRLSQQSEGDIIGLPELSDGVTRFCPPEWYMTACREPRIVFLDEINRATPEVMQAAFQIVLDYELNGYKLHPDTRVYAAVNPDQGGYAVSAMDPALIDRFAVIELEPTLEDWVAWAQTPRADGGGELLSQIVNFIKANPGFLHVPAEAHPGRKYQSPRSWELLDRAIRHAALDDCFEKNPLLYALALSRVGVEASIQFQDYVATMERQITADDVLNKWGKKMGTQIKKLGAERYNIIIEKLGEHSKTNTWEKNQLDNVSKFMETLPGEHMIQVWNLVAQSGNLENVKGIHARCVKLLMEHLAHDQDEKKAKK